MCGIAGIVGQAANGAEARAVVERMCHSIQHRGPDGSGIYSAAHVCLGHRRLSIIDLAAGQQPMTTADGRYTVVFNGEIYNHESVRDELRARGHEFHTKSDTEVLLQSYLAYGRDCARHLNGMFAFAIWDEHEKLLFCARDRIGIKPLYFTEHQGSLYFGSEIKTLLRTGIPGELDAQAVDDYFAYGFIHAPRSIYRGVRALLPGHSLTVRYQSDRIEHNTQRYWDVTASAEPAAMNFEEAKGELSRLLLDAVKLCLMSEVPLGAFLSGGIDSSTVVWAMAQLQQTPVQTFSIGFEEARYDETSIAREVAKRFGTVHHEERVTPDAVATLPELIRGFDEPFGDPSAIPTWYVCRMARRQVTVCLSGDGGDELFHGYNRYQTVQREWQSRRGLDQRLLSWFGKLAPAESRLRNRAERLSLSTPGAHYARFRNNFSPAMRKRLFSAAASSQLDFDLTQNLLRHGAAAELVEAQGVGPIADLQGYLPDDVLCKVDRMSMAHSLEARVPLLDHRLVEFVQRLPRDFKTRAGKSKAILRAIIEPHLPAAVLTHPKQGFSVPLAQWFRGPLKGRLQDALSGPTFKNQDWFRPGYVQHLFHLHQSATVDLSFALWQLLVFDEWWRTRAQR